MKKLSLLLILGFIIKLFLAFLIPISYDEAYYWIWGQNLQWSYYDHPPFVALLLKIGNWFNLSNIKGGIRIPGLILSHGTLIIWIHLAKKYLKKDEDIFIFAMLLLSFPLLGVGGIIITPDLPLLFFWSLCFAVFIELLNKRTIKEYALIGILLGLGFASKYHIVLFFLSGCIYLTFDKKWKSIQLKLIPVSFIFFFLGSFPVWLWNINNDFQSFRFQLNHGLGKSNYMPEWTADYILGQLLIISPWIIYWAYKGINKKNLLLAALAFTPVVFFLITSFRGHVEANWPITAYAAFLMLAISGGLPRRSALIHCAVWTVLVSSIVIYISWPGKANDLNPIMEQFKYEKYTEFTKKYSPLYAGRYQMASILWINSGEPIYKLRGLSRFDFFDTLPGSLPKEQEYYLMVDNQMIFDPDSKLLYSLEQVFIDDLITIYKVTQ